MKQERASWRGALWLRRRRVRGRRHFIWGFIVLRFALPVTILATAARALTEPFRWPHFLLHLLVNVVAAGLGGGYVAGRLLWDLIVARSGPGATGAPGRPMPQGGAGRRRTAEK